MYKNLLFNKKSVTIFFSLESEEHGNGYDGYNVISHIPKEDPIPIIFPKLFKENEGKIRILLKNEKRVFDKYQFGEYCKTEYFEKHIKKIMFERVFTLPDVDFSKSNRNPILQAPFDVIMRTMKNWCDKFQEEGDIKGLVIFGYSLDDHLKFLKYSEDILKNYLYNKTYADFQETITVYNPQKKIIFVIRRIREKEDLEHEMKSSLDDILKFVFLYNDILKNSGIKLINLLATDADVDCYRWKCKFCEHQVIPMNSLDSSDSFQKWLEQKECNFETDYHPANKNNTFSFDFSAKLLGFLASFQFSKENHFNWALPSLTDNRSTQMAETTILLTLEQLRIVNSPNKHLMIQGCYGSGKSLVALKKAEMTSKILKPNEIMCFISYDSSSMFTTDIESTVNMKLYRNKSALKLSNIINNIKEAHPEHKINLVVDEYDGEQLDETEAKKLNKTFTRDEKFRNSIICLVFESLERERMVNGVRQRANLLHLLKSMELKELTYNKRNTLQIHDLVKVTTDVLKNQTTKVLVPLYKGQDSKTQLGLDNALVKERNIEEPDQISMVQQPKEDKDEDIDKIENLSKNKKFIFDEVCKYFKFPIDVSVVTNEVTTTFRHRESKHSGHSIESEKPNIYKIFHSQGSAEFLLSLIVVLEQIIINHFKKIEKYVILHFNVEKDIPYIFYMAFKMMGILENVTDKYEIFKKGDSKKIFVASFRAFRGLEYPRVVIVVDQNLIGLEQYLPECLNRCTTYLHAVLLKEDIHMLKQTQHESRTMQNIITAWTKRYMSKSLINYWIVHIFGSHTNEVSNKFYEKRDTGVIKIYSTSKKYKELKANYGKLQFLQNENNTGNIIQEEIESAVER